MSGLRVAAATFESCVAFDSAQNDLNSSLLVAELFCPVQSPIIQNVSAVAVAVGRRTADKAALVDALGRLIENDSTNLTLHWEREPADGDR
jgi:hypothetical protein